MNDFDLNNMDDDEEESLGGAPAPASTIAGPQTQRDQVMKRIAQVRGAPGSENPAADQPSGGDMMDPRNQAAMDFAKQSAMTAGIGRGLNALSAGTGYKPDNSGYDAMEKRGSDFMEKEISRSDAVKKAIEDRKMKAAVLSAHQADNEANRALKDRQVTAYDKRTNTMGGVAQNRLDTANIRAANTILNDKNVQTEAKKLQTAKSAQSLVDAIRNGDIKDSKNVAKQLTNMITTIEMGTPGGVGDRQASGVDTLYGKLQGMLSYVNGKPNSTIPAEYLDQLESETHALGDRAAANYKGLTEGALSGADLSMGNPDADPGKVHALAKQRRDMILSGNGYDPETGMPKGRPAHGAKNTASAGGDLINDAHAGVGRITEKDVKALKWSKDPANANDPNLKRVLQHLSAVGLK